MASVVIVGAGPAGAALSYLLARRGIGVTLLEQHRDFARVFRGEGFQPSGIEALRQMGLGKQLDALPSSEIKDLEIWYRGRRLAHIDLVEYKTKNDPRIISQPALLEMLAGEAGRFPGFRLHRGAGVRDLLRRDGRITGVAADKDGERREFRAELVIGADGRDSMVRRKAGLHVERKPQSFDFVWCYLPRPAFWPAGHSELFFADEGGGVIVLPSYSGRLQLGLNIAKGSFKQFRSAESDAWLEAILGLVRRELAEHIAASRNEVGSPSLLSVVCDYLTEWTAPGVLLLGDAAHPMSPVGGQGVNVALRDTLVAANHLVPVLTRHPAASADEIDAACRRVQQERGAEVLAIQKLQTRHAQVLLARGLKAAVIRNLIPVLMKFAAVRRRSFTGERGFGRLQQPIRLEV